MSSSEIWGLKGLGRMSSCRHTFSDGGTWRYCLLAGVLWHSSRSVRRFSDPGGRSGIGDVAGSTQNSSTLGQPGMSTV